MKNIYTKPLSFNAITLFIFCIVFLQVKCVHAQMAGALDETFGDEGTVITALGENMMLPRV